MLLDPLTSLRPWVLRNMLGQSLNRHENDKRVAALGQIRVNNPENMGVEKRGPVLSQAC